MIDEFVMAYMERKGVLRVNWSTAPPRRYKDIVEAVVSILPAESEDNFWNMPSSERIHEIDDGDYQGTLVYVIGATGYQPSKYWYVKVGYGSCSGCDTLNSILGYRMDDEPVTGQQLDDLLTLALHIVQGIKVMGDD